MHSAQRDAVHIATLTESHWWLWYSSFETSLTVNSLMQVVRECEGQSRWRVSLEQVQTPPALTNDDSSVPTDPVDFCWPRITRVRVEVAKIN